MPHDGGPDNTQQRGRRSCAYLRRRAQAPAMIDITDAPTESDLMAVGPPDTEPSDFDAFWRSTRDVAMEVDPQPAIRPIWSPDPAISVFEVQYTSYGGERIGGWMTVPEDPRGAVVVGHGYGVRKWFEMDYSERGFATFFPSIRGFGLSGSRSIPWITAEHVVHGIEHRDSYVLRGCVADLWLAASVLLDYLSGVTVGSPLPLAYVGGSFCGGLGALMLPWDERFRAAYLRHPTFGHHPIRLEIPSAGSAESVRLYALDHPEVRDVLAYYDAATAATRVTIPTLCAPALLDPKVTPLGQFAIANALRNRELFTLPVGHAAGPPGYDETLRTLTERVFSFFEDHLGISDTTQSARSTP